MNCGLGKKLTVNRETLRALSGSEMQAFHGGRMMQDQTSKTCPPPPSIPCPTHCNCPHHGLAP